MRTKKRMRAILTLALAVVMVLSLSATAFAAATSITITGVEGPGTAGRFKAYQIFSGQVTETSDQLSNIAWGSGVDSTGLIAEMKTGLTGFSAVWEAWKTAHTAEPSTDPRSEAQMVAQFLDEQGKVADSTVAHDFAKIAANHLSSVVAGSSAAVEDKKAVINLDAPGYYLVLDDLGGNVDGAVSSYMLKVAGAENIAIKSSVPVVTKTSNSIAEIAEEVTFVLDATLPNNYDEYTSYALSFVDTLSKGLTYTGDNDVTIAVDGNPIVAGKYSITQANGASDSKIITFAITNLKDSGVTVSKDSHVTVTYKAKLNEFAVVGDAGNPNSVKITYSNDPYTSSQTGTSETPDEVKTYTLGLDIEKKDGSSATQAALDGAKFKLKKGDQYAVLTGTAPEYKLAGWDTTGTEIETMSGGKLSIDGLEIGTYTLEETVPPTGYEKMTSVTFTIAGGLTQDGALDTISVSMAAERDDASVTTTDTNGQMKAVLYNYKIAQLPVTGGEGLMALIMVGVLGLIGGTYIVIKATKKKENSAE